MDLLFESFYGVEVPLICSSVSRRHVIFSSIVLVSRTVFGRLWCRCDGSGLRLSRTSDLIISLRRAFFEGDTSGQWLSSLEESLVSGRRRSSSRIIIGFFPFLEYIVTFSIWLFILFGSFIFEKYSLQTVPIVVGPFYTTINFLK